MSFGSWSYVDSYGFSRTYTGWAWWSPDNILYDDLGRALRVIGNGFQLVTRATPLAVRYVGGVEQVRDLPGTTERPTYRAIEAAKQRDALKFLQKSIFSVDAFRRDCLLKGLDDIGLTLRHGAAIDAYEQKRRQEQPWA